MSIPAAVSTTSLSSEGCAWPSADSSALSLIAFAAYAALAAVWASIIVFGIATI